MSALRESPDYTRQLLAAIARELARATKHRRTYQAAGHTVAVARLTRRMRMLAHLRDEAALDLDPTARVVTDDGTLEPTHGLVWPIEPAGPVVLPIDTARPARNGNTAPRLEFPAMTAEGVGDDDPLSDLV